MVDTTRASAGFYHQPVLLREVIDVLDLQDGDQVIDGTVGLGGHAEAIMRIIGISGRLLAIDQDGQALEIAKQRLSLYKDQIIFAHNRFDHLQEIIAEHHFAPNKILLDIGVSSLQLDDSARGFSFLQDAPLDMRMDMSTNVSAYELINSISQQELVRILREYGEEHFAVLVSKRLARIRDKHPIVSTQELAQEVERALPQAEVRKRYGKGQNPATKVFQALRIAVNDELGALQRVLPQCIEALKPTAGMIAIITFHSLEDRMVKQFFAHAIRECVCPPAMPVCGCGKKPSARILNKQPMVASEEEMQRNPRSRSAKLRGYQILE